MGSREACGKFTVAISHTAATYMPNPQRGQAAPGKASAAAWQGVFYGLSSGKEIVKCAITVWKLPFKFSNLTEDFNFSVRKLNQIKSNDGQPRVSRKSEYSEY